MNETTPAARTWSKTHISLQVPANLRGRSLAEPEVIRIRVDRVGAEAYGGQLDWIRACDRDRLRWDHRADVCRILALQIETAGSDDGVEGCVDYCRRYGDKGEYSELHIFWDIDLSDGIHQHKMSAHLKQRA